MCGNSGCAGYLLDPDKKTMTDLLVLNIVRGADSTGLAAVDRNSNISLVRALGTPFGDHGDSPGLFGLKSFDKVMKINSKVMIGHNRSATVGDLSVQNAHPFKFPEIVGAHNGTITFSSRKNLLGHEYYETDSEALFNSIQEKGLVETISLIEGAWALVYYDRRNDTLNFLRNKERPLNYIFSENNKTMFWSSDPSPLLYACHRNKINIGKNVPKSFEEDTWYSWKVPEVYTKFQEPEKTIVKGEQSSYSVGHFKGCTAEELAEWYGEDYLGVPPHVSNSTFETKPEQVSLFLPTTDKKVIEGVFIEKKPRQDVPVVRLVDKISAAVNTKFKEQYPSLPKDWVERYSDATNKVFFSPLNQRWNHFAYMHATNRFMQYTLSYAPKVVPFKKIKVESGGSHLFSYKKYKVEGQKKKERLICYKGYKGIMLTERMFGEIASSGCFNCQRSPEWGNEVRFFTPKEFLCEHCSSMNEVVKLVEGIKR